MWALYVALYIDLYVTFYMALSTLTFLYANVYDLSLPIRSFEGPLYTLYPFTPLSPPVGGLGGGLRLLCLRLLRLQ